jgi:hypothetical protein
MAADGAIDLSSRAGGPGINTGGDWAIYRSNFEEMKGRRGPARRAAPSSNGPVSTHPLRRHR